jgi:hypothetical protein
MIMIHDGDGDDADDDYHSDIYIYILSTIVDHDYSSYDKNVPRSIKPISITYLVSASNATDCDGLLMLFHHQNTRVLDYIQ